MYRFDPGVRKVSWSHDLYAEDNVAARSEVSRMSQLTIKFLLLVHMVLIL
jgi:hypothetical protein